MSATTGSRALCRGSRAALSSSTRALWAQRASPTPARSSPARARVSSRESAARARCSPTRRAITPSRSPTSWDDPQRGQQHRFACEDPAFGLLLDPGSFEGACAIRIDPSLDDLAVLEGKNDDFFQLDVQAAAAPGASPTLQAH